MGFAKHQATFQQERGWSSIDKFVCSDCLSDPDLQAVVVEKGDDDEPCSYCGRSPSCPADELMEAINAGVRSEWEDASEAGLFWDGREGGYQGVEVIDSYDFFHDVVDPFENEDLRADVVDAYFSQGTEWVRRQFWRIPDHEVLLDGWEAFCSTVKHKSRFMFLADPSALKSYGDDHVPPGRFLNELGQLVLRLGLVVPLPAQTRFYRARLHKPGDTITLPGGLAAPRREHAKYSNRMSPVGIPMFYGATDLNTCVAELGHDPSSGPTECTAGIFETGRPLRVLDLTRIPRTPGLFAPPSELKDERPRLRFLNGFTRDVSRPVKKDELAHVEYAPTQIVTEYVRRVLRCQDGAEIEGVIYSSAAHPGGTCCVLFVNNEQTCSLHPAWEKKTQRTLFGPGPFKFHLALDPSSVVTFSL